MACPAPTTTRSTNTKAVMPAHEWPEAAERALKRGGVYALGESYARGEWEVEHLDQFMVAVMTAESDRPRWRTPFRIAGQVARELLFNLQHGARAFEVGRRHYDLGNDLFEAMLDSTMTYTCGYWASARNLQEAQEAKLQLLCEKLKLEPGMRVLDIGCGWGNFARFAAERFRVKVVGLTVSEEQARFARTRCYGFPVEILLQDYATFTGDFDRIVSIEMIEAVGRKNMKRYFNTIARCLPREGLFALQVISGEAFSPYSKPVFDEFIAWLVRHIFPNGYLPKLSEIVEPARGDFVLEDLHSFGVNYDHTLCAWLANFDRAWPLLEPRYGPEFGRRWRFYLATCAALFRARMVQLYQVVYSKGGVVGGYSTAR